MPLQYLYTITASYLLVGGRIWLGLFAEIVCLKRRLHQEKRYQLMLFVYIVHAITPKNVVPRLERFNRLMVLSIPLQNQPHKWQLLC